MALQGDLGSIPLGDVIQLVSSTQRSGTLYVAAPEDARVFAFRKGDLVSASSLEQRFRIGVALCQRGLLDPTQLDEALAEQRTSPGRTLGDVLLARGAVTPGALYATLRDQVQVALDDALHWQDGGFLFADAGEGAPTPGDAFPVAPLLMESMRKLDEWGRVSQPFEDRAAIVDFARSMDEVGDASLPPGSDDALQVLEHVDGRRAVSAIIMKLPWSEHRVIRALATLLESGFIRVRGVSESSKFVPSLLTERGRWVTIAPRAGARAIALAGTEAAGVVELHAAAMADPGLAVAVLRAATSIGRHEGEQFATLRDAFVALGEDTVRRVLVAAGLRGCYCDASARHHHDVWRHSLVTAVAAARLSSALRMPRERAAEAYLCGLLHDVGILMLRSSIAGYEGVDRLVERGTPRVDAERKLIGVGHDKVGAHALENWGAAPSAIDVALTHHMGSKDDPWQLALVQAADAIAAHVGFDAESLASAAPLEKVAAKTVGLSGDALERVVKAVEEEACARDPLW